jgi:hypothetical protein
VIDNLIFFLEKPSTWIALIFPLCLSLFFFGRELKNPQTSMRFYVYWSFCCALSILFSIFSINYDEYNGKVTIIQYGLMGDCWLPIFLLLMFFSAKLKVSKGMVYTLAFLNALIPDVLISIDPRFVGFIVMVQGDNLQPHNILSNYNNPVAMNILNMFYPDLWMGIGGGGFQDGLFVTPLLCVILYTLIQFRKKQHDKKIYLDLQSGKIKYSDLKRK